MFGARYKGIWSSWQEIEEYAYLLDLPTVPVLFKGIVNTNLQLIQLIEGLVHKPSILGGIREGIVGRIQREFIDEEFETSVFKWVRKDHVQTTEHWTKRWSWADIKIKYE